LTGDFLLSLPGFAYDIDTALINQNFENATMNVTSKLETARSIPKTAANKQSLASEL